MQLKGETQAGRGVYIIVHLQDPEEETDPGAHRLLPVGPASEAACHCFVFFLLFALKNYISSLQDAVQMYLCQEAFPTSGVPGSLHSPTLL